MRRNAPPHPYARPVPATVAGTVVLTLQFVALFALLGLAAIYPALAALGLGTTALAYLVARALHALVGPHDGEAGTPEGPART